MTGILSQFFARLFKPIVKIQPQERKKTCLMFIYFFLTIALVYILKPVRNSLFLEELGAKNLRYVYMGEGVFLVLVVWAYVQFARRVSKRVLYAGVLAFFISNLILFWFFVHAHVPYLSAFFYIWVASFSITMTTQFWTLANDIFNPAEAKRLFGFIISGGSIGGILGGLFTSQIIRWLRTEDLLLVTAGILGLCMLVTDTLLKQIHPVEAIGANANSHPGGKLPTAEKEKITQSTPRILFKSSYLMMLIGLIILAKISSTIVDNQFSKMVEISITTRDARTAYFGGFMAWLNAISFFMQFFVTSLALRYLGVGISLWILPVGLFFTSLASFFNPVLLTGLIIKFFDGGINYSIQTASKEVLYLPISSAIRYRVKPVMDMLGFRLAKSLAGLYIAVMAACLGIPDQRLSVLVIFLIPLWVVLVWKLKKGYSKLLRNKLIHHSQFERVTRTERATDVLSLLYHEKTLESMKSLLVDRSSYARKVAASTFLLHIKAGRDFESVRRTMDEMIRREAIEMIADEHTNQTKGNDQGIQSLEDLIVHEVEKKIQKKEPEGTYLKDYPEEALIKLAAILKSPEGNGQIKRRAVRVLELIPRQEAADILLMALGCTQDHGLRFMTATALNRLHDQNSELNVSPFLIKSEIAREVSINKKIRGLHVFYKHQVQEQDKEDYLGITFKAIRDESFERLFCFLDLLYPHEMIRIIYDRIVEHPHHDHLRSHAVELLSNTVGPNLAILIQPVLEEQEPKPFKEKDVIAALHEFANSNDPWFGLISVFLISELRLDQRWPALASIKKKLELHWIL